MAGARWLVPVLCCALLVCLFAGGLWFLARPAQDSGRLAALEADIASLEREQAMLRTYLASPACAGKK